MKQAHVFISGFVQGVGLRAFIKNHAEELHVRGWVKNLPVGKAGIPDDRVEAVFQGDMEDIERLIKLCRKGPFLAEVEKVDVAWEDAPEPYQDFKIEFA